MAKNSRGGWLLYCMVHVPLIWKFKVGITSLSIGAKRRARAIDRAVFGFPVPIMVVPIPFGAYKVEQEMHRIMRPFQTRFYKGDGGSEWFNIVPLFFAVPVMLCIWLVYLFGIDLMFGTSIAPVCAEAFFNIIFLVVK